MHNERSWKSTCWFYFARWPGFVLPFFGAAFTAADTPSRPLILELKLDGEVEPILATYIDEGLTDAARRQAALVLVTMDTPGGLSDSMTEIIHHILDSPVPVVVYVSPDGARGASAGFLILLSADVAAMAPGTRTGAATPDSYAGLDFHADG